MSDSPADRRALGDFVWVLVRRTDFDLPRLGARTGLAPVEIAQLLAGEHTPDQEACRQLARALGCDVLTLLYLAGHVSLAVVFAAQEPGPTAHQLLAQAFHGGHAAPDCDCSLGYSGGAGKYCGSSSNLPGRSGPAGLGRNPCT